MRDGAMTGPIDTFFYGLFMDGQVLKDAGVTPRSARRASAGGFTLAIGKRATLVRAPGSIAWGMVYALTPDELARLYGAPGLEAYQPQDIEVALENRAIIPARVYILPHPPAPDERNPDYAEKLKAALTRPGMPADYVAGVE
jgi:Gamma-glutamyl cyclotransferase, AIG2-like